MCGGLQGPTSACQQAASAGGTAWDASEPTVVLGGQTGRACFRTALRMCRMCRAPVLWGSGLRAAAACPPACSQGHRDSSSTAVAGPDSQLCPEVPLSPNSLQDGKEYLFQAKDEVSWPLLAPRLSLCHSQNLPVVDSPLFPLLSFSLSVSLLVIREVTMCHPDVCEGHTKTCSPSSRRHFLQ